MKKFRLKLYSPVRLNNSAKSVNYIIWARTLLDTRILTKLFLLKNCFRCSKYKFRTLQLKLKLTSSLVLHALETYIMYSNPQQFQPREYLLPFRLRTLYLYIRALKATWTIGSVRYFAVRHVAARAKCPVFHSILRQLFESSLHCISPRSLYILIWTWR